MPYKVILADPSPSVQKVVQMAFPEPEFEVQAIEDGLQVIEALDRIDPDAVLLSPDLPSRDGYEVGHYLRSRKESKNVVLILIKNAFEPLDKERLNGLACDAIIQKPFDSERLARLIRETVDRHKVPPSFPEESLIEDVPSAGVLPLFQEEEFIPSPPSSGSREDLEDRIRILLREEILSVERELEKRLKASLRADLKEWLDKEKR
ncbi:MAG: response regulator [Candidatus Aminicenantes bacterium]|nr:response regulator [Candidatus Aminicenantes bacterium]